MGVEFYVFALFIFALAVMLIVLIFRGKNKNKAKEDEERDERDKKIMMMYFEVEDMIDALKEYVEASRDRIEADISRIETDMQALATMRDSLHLISNHVGARPEQSAPEPPAEIPPEPEAKEQDEQRTAAVSMKEQGKDVDQIAQQMNLSKTEVAFMLKLDAYRNSGNGEQGKNDEKRLKF